MGIEPSWSLQTRKLLILRSDRPAKAARNAEAEHTAGSRTRPTTCRCLPTITLLELQRFARV